VHLNANKCHVDHPLRWQACAFSYAMEHIPHKNRGHENHKHIVVARTLQWRRCTHVEYLSNTWI